MAGDEVSGAYAPKYESAISPNPRYRVNHQNAPKDKYASLKETLVFCPRCETRKPLRYFISKPKSQRKPHRTCNACRGGK